MQLLLIHNIHPPVYTDIATPYIRNVCGTKSPPHGDKDIQFNNG